MTVIIGGGSICESIRSRSRSIVIKNKDFNIIKEELLEIDKCSKIETIIVTAGFLEKTIVGEFTGDVLERTITANFILPVQVANFAVANFPQANLVFFSSSVVFEPREGYSAYSASKTGLEIFLRTLMIETPTKNIKIIRNARTDTKLRWDNYDKTDENMKNLLSPDEVAKVTLEFIEQSGQVIEIYKRGGEVHKDIWSERK